MAINNFKPFALDPNANVTSQADWEALPALLSGFTAGKASSAQVNKAIRQASFIAAALAQYTANKSGLDVLDDGDLNGFISKMGTAFGKDFQALDATLSALAGLATGANKLPYFTGNDTAAQTDLTSVGRDIIGKKTIADILTYLGLGASAFGLQNIVVFNTPGVYNWNVPEALQQGRKCQVTVIGGGASGGSTTDTTKRGGGGGGGGYSKLLLDLTDVSSVTVTVGFAGAGVTTGNGASGGSSSFGSYLSATGGQYGYGGTSTSGGSSGAGVGGDVNQGLGWGDDGSANSANCGGNGGGPGGRGSTGGGLDAPGYGGGGGGIAANSSNKSGSGKNGIVIIEW